MPRKARSSDSARKQNSPALPCTPHNNATRPFRIRSSHLFLSSYWELSITVVMIATPIPLHVIHTVFQYILPPSLPLPPHLLSKPLTERHHFLSISPTDPTSYLCWSSSDAPEVTEALERGVPDTLASEPDYEVRYTTLDEETVLAHVRPDAHSPLRIVFVWDAETVTWRYHDARMLPFPKASLPSLDAAPRGASGFEWPTTIVDQPSNNPWSASTPADDYWAGYESSASSPDTSALPQSIPSEDDDKAEAAYWASYAIVHGRSRVAQQ